MAAAAAAIASSPRYLVLRDLHKALAPPIPRLERGDERSTVKPADPGCMQLFSYYKPSLEAGNYAVKVSQEIDFTEFPFPQDNGDLHKTLLVKDNNATTLFQNFKVIAPQYKIDMADVHSTYPPQGQADQPSVLPHIVFSDPHLPWERSASDEKQTRNDSGKVSTPILPWLAVFPFDCLGPDSELVIGEDQLKNVQQLLGLKEAPKPTSKFTISMTLEQYRSLPGTTSKPSNIRVPIIDQDDVQDDPDIPVDVTFMNRSLFIQLFRSPGLDSFKYCAHVRNVNTSGMTNAGIQDNGLFSIVHSNRTGPTNVVQNSPPRTQVVHLLSLEGVDRLKIADGISTIDSIGENDLVAFVSLYSWTYLCQPPLTVNFVDSMRQIGDDIDDPKFSPYLGCPKSMLSQLEKSIKAGEANPSITTSQIKMNRARRKMFARLSNGYSLVRHRTASGEETVAINRGALLPVISETPAFNWPYASDNGQDMQILDQELGLMDISYSTAWQLGKTMAISDLAFVAALLRVRGDAYKTGAVASKTFTATQIAGFKDKTAVLKGIRMSMSAVNDIANPNVATPVPDLHERFKMNSLDRSQLLQSKSNPAVVSNAKKAFVTAVNTRLTVAGSNAGTEGSKPYDEISPPEDVDWAFVQSWLLDRMYLYNIPAHYLVPEPNFLPLETMRFFHIDQTWIETLVDGALSVANHMDKADDSVRDGIKKCMNKYFETPFSTTDESGSEKMLHYPQVPTYGFFLRSAVIDIFPDLVVEIPYPETEEEEKARILSNPYGKTTSSSGVLDTNAPTSATDKSPQPGKQGKLPSHVQNGRTSVLVQKQMGPGVLMVLLDRVPSDGEIAYIQLTQPAHQQRFSAGDFLDDKKIQFQFRDPVYRDGGQDFLDTTGPLYTFYSGPPDPASDSPDGEPGVNTPETTPSNTPGEHTHGEGADVDGSTSPVVHHDPRKPPSSSPRWECPYDWQSRCLDMTKMEKLLYGANGIVKEGFLTSAITGLELNDTMKYLQLMPPDRDHPATDSKQKPYKLRVREKRRPQAAFNKRSKLNNFDMPALGQDLPSLTAPQAIDPLPSTASSINSGSRSAATPPIRELSLRTLQLSSTSKPTLLKAAAVGSSSVIGQRDSACYDCVIYPSTTTYAEKKPNTPDRRSFVWVDTPYDADLIFSLVRRDNPPGLSLRSIEFYIPLGQSKSKRSRLPDSDGLAGLGLVKEGRCGTRCRMLSNQRWIVHIDAVKGGEYVLLRVVPRSIERSSPVANNVELTFRLDEVTLDGGDGSYLTEGPVTIKKREVFGTLTSRGVEDKGDQWNEQGYTSKDIVVNRKKGFIEPPDMWS